jgi:hypothetical protein
VVKLEQGKSGAPLDLVIKTLAALGYALDAFDDTPARVPAGPGSIGRSSRHTLRARSKAGAPGPETGRHSSDPLDDMGPPQDPGESLARPAASACQVTDASAIDVVTDRDRLYQPDYRAALTRIAMQIIASEAPLFEDLLARRIARAHGLTRASSKLLQITKTTVQGFPRSSEDGRTIIWPEGAEVGKLVPFRSLGARDHVDVPLVELASLAVPLLKGGRKPEETVILVGREMGLGSLRTTTRLRLVSAIKLAQQHIPNL